MKIIGISSHMSGVHDNSAVLMDNGKIIFAEAEERISRIKHDGRFPWLAIQEAFKVAKIKPGKIDYFVSANPNENIILAFLASLKLIPAVGVSNYLWHFLKRLTVKVEKLNGGDYPYSYFESGFPRHKLVKIPHYLAHAASTYYSGPFDRCLVVCMDGFGLGAKGQPLSGEIYLGEKGKLRLLERIPVWGSLGLYYGAVTKALGFKLNDGEGKTMGLAVYGRPEPCYQKMKLFFPNFSAGKWSARSSIMDILNIQRKGVFEETPTFLMIKKWVERYGREQVASSAQKVFEEELEKYFIYLVKKYHLRKIASAGGIFLNVKANMRLLKNKIIDDFFIYPNPSDGGTAMGAAIIGSLMKGVEVKRREIFHSAYGRKYSDTEIKRVLEKYKGIKYQKLGSNLPQKVARLLTQGNVIGWFQGRGEWGPRALGQRSVIADPRSKKVKDRINDILKGREWFMPFAPSMLAERASDYLLNLRKSPFMIIADDTTKKAKKGIPAAIHIDYTARPQLVTRKANKLYYDLIKEFERLTGVGSILNTSFNKHGLPIVYTPENAIDHLLWKTIDKLVISNYLVERNL